VAGKKERQRRLARERYQRRLGRQAQRAHRMRQWTVIGFVAAIVIALAVGGAVVAARSLASPSETCTYTKSGTAARKVNLPPSSADPSATYQATVKTNRGSIVINLLNNKATCTVNSFVSLADQGYFNKTPCHRLTTAGSLFVLQCGDPTGTGSGGPGYKFDDENLAHATYNEGTVAMANSGPNTNGSQFFLVYKNSTLAPSYTPFGTIASGINIIQNVAKAGSNNANGQGDGAPNEKVEIESVIIKQT
jgi:peptidyl-prolyl cis-trans isomerase B (cyclophilin B)